MSIPTIRFHVDSSKVKAAIKPRPKEIARVNRLVVNKLVATIHKETGRELAVLSGVKILSFKRVRTFKTLAKAKSKKVIGKVWLGGNRVAARYAGKPRNVKGGARAGKHFFKDAFVVKFDSGYTSIFKRTLLKTRTGKAKLEEQTVPIINLHNTSQSILSRNIAKTEQMLHTELSKVLSKRR